MDDARASSSDDAPSPQPAAPDEAPAPPPPLSPPPPVEDMLAKIAAYVEGEAEMSLEDYRLLEVMNCAAAERYSGMADYSSGLVAFAERLQTKCDDMLPQLAQVCEPASRLSLNAR